MTFSDILTGAFSNVEGVKAVGLIGVDGLGVETLIADDLEMDSAAIEIELASLVNSVNCSCTALAAGSIKEMYIEAEKSSYFISLLNTDYFLAIILGDQANLGKARFEVKRIRQLLQKNM